MNETNEQPPPRPNTWTASRVIAVVWIPIIILVMAALLWPSRLGPRTRRTNSRRANCLSNLKQIGIAIQMYAESYGGRYPTDSAINPTLLGSMQLLSNTLTSAKAFYCPDDRRRGARAEADFRKLTTRNISYSFVPNQVWSTNRESSAIIIALDRIYSTSAGSTWPKNGNHEDAGGNVLFNDGHIKWHNKLPSALTDKDGKEIVLSP